MAPGTDNKIKILAACTNSVMATTSHIPLPQWKTAMDTRQQNGEMKWKTKYEEADRRRKSLLTESQKSNYNEEWIPLLLTLNNRK